MSLVNLPSNLLFRLGRKSNFVIIGNQTIYRIGEPDSPSDNFLHSRRKHPLLRVDTISRLEEIYETNFSKDIREWKDKKMQSIKKARGMRVDYTPGEFELLKFIVYDVVPHFGVYVTKGEERAAKEFVPKRREEKTVWEGMLYNRNHDLENFAIIKQKVYKLEPESEEEPISSNMVHVQLDGKRHFLTEFAPLDRLDKEYNRAISRMLHYQVVDELKKSPEAEFKALVSILDEFDRFHRNIPMPRGITRDSSRTYTAYAETPPKYALFCKFCQDMHGWPVHHVFDRGRIEVKIRGGRTRDDIDYTKPRLAWSYPHPHVWQEDNHRDICYGDFSVDHLMATDPNFPIGDIGLHIAIWLINGIRGLVSSTIAHGTYVLEHPFEKKDFDYVARNRIPITNVKRKVVLEC